MESLSAVERFSLSPGAPRCCSPKCCSANSGVSRFRALEDPLLVLQCGHFVCRACFSATFPGSYTFSHEGDLLDLQSDPHHHNSVPSSTLKCPLCGEPDLRSLASIKESTLFSGLLSQIGQFLPPDSPNDEGATTKMCENCEEQEATAFCLKCDLGLCAKCDAEAHTFKAFRSHQRVDAAEMRKRERESRMAESMVCPQHDGERTSIFCLTCRVPCCLMCREYGGHRGHRTVMRLEAHDVVTSDLHRSVVFLKEAIEATETVGRRATATIDDLNGEHATAKIAIDGAADRIIEAVNCRRKQLQDDLERRHTDAISQLQKQRDEALNQVSECRALMSVAKFFSEDDAPADPKLRPSDTVGLQAAMHVSASAKAAASSANTLASTATSDSTHLTFILDEKQVEQVLDSISSIGAVFSGPESASAAIAASLISSPSPSQAMGQSRRSSAPIPIKASPHGTMQLEQEHQAEPAPLLVEEKEVMNAVSPYLGELHLSEIPSPPIGGFGGGLSALLADTKSELPPLSTPPILTPSAQEAVLATLMDHTPTYSKWTLEGEPFSNTVHSGHPEETLATTPEDSSAITQPDDPLSLATKAEFLFSRGLYEDAIENAKQAIHLDPALGSAFSVCAEAEKMLGRYDDSISHATTAIELDDKTSSGCFRTRADCFRECGKYAEAIQDATEALKHNPKDSLAYWTRAESYRMLGQHEAAISDASEALKMDSRNSYALFTRAESRRALGQNDLAIADANAALAIDPKDDSLAHSRSSYSSTPFFLK